jgi:hypothetical protein
LISAHQNVQIILNFNKKNFKFFRNAAATVFPNGRERVEVVGSRGEKLYGTAIKISHVTK